MLTLLPSHTHTVLCVAFDYCTVAHPHYAWQYPTSLPAYRKRFPPYPYRMAVHNDSSQLQGVSTV